MWNAVQLFEPSPSSVPIIDSELKHYGRLWVPLTCVAPTKALARWLKGGKHQPALCAAYQFGQCLAGEGCAQAHVLVPFMTDVQRFLQERPFANCCFEHGDLASKRSDFQALLRRRRVELRTDAGVISIMPASLAVTAFFDTLAKEDPSSTAIITLDASKVCKLHQRQQCTYGADCRNVHLCRHFWGCVPADHKHVPEPTPVPSVVAPPIELHSLPSPKSLFHATPVAPPRRPSTALTPPPTPQAAHQRLHMGTSQLAATAKQCNDSPVVTTEELLSHLLELVHQDHAMEGSNMMATSPVPWSPMVYVPHPAPSIAPVEWFPNSLAPSWAVGDVLSQCSPDFSLFHHFPAQHTPPSTRRSCSSEGSAATLEDVLDSPAGLSEDDSVGCDFDVESLRSEEGNRPLLAEACQPWAADWLSPPLWASASHDALFH
eukprot:GGOE01033473.1.p1 GENE.GGOE01033473.1~~GGOE01033473.1.p1  ORF type:complete len:450 (+),score=112.86 GGOE01033473.1:56-1351(+)